MSAVAVTFDFLQKKDKELIEILNWSPGEIKIGRKLLQSKYQSITLPKDHGDREIQTLWGQVELLEGDKRVDFMVFTHQTLFVIEVKGHKTKENVGMPWSSMEKNPWKQCSEYLNVVKEIIKDNLKVVGLVVFTELEVSSDLLEEINEYAEHNFGIHSYFSKELNKMSFDRIFDQIIGKQLNGKSSTLNMLCAMKNLVPGSFVSEDISCSTRIPLEVFDSKQIQFAKNITLDGDRIVYGVAGSGKTMMLISKAQSIAEFYGTKTKILVICHNRPLRKFLETKLSNRNIEIRTVFSWYNSITKLWGSKKLREQISKKELKRLDDFRVIERMIELGLDNGNTFPSYDFILIDEGQDISSTSFEHLKLAHRQKGSNLFLVFLDNVQVIHKRRSKRFRWIDVGINAVGRTRYFYKNYRNAEKIAVHALNIVNKLIEKRKNEEGYSNILIETREIARTGGEVIIDRWIRKDVNYNLIGLIKQIPLHYSIMIIYGMVKQPSKIMNVNEAFKKWQCPRIIHHCSKDEIMPLGVDVPLYSLYRCKGLEADVVIFLRRGTERVEQSFVGTTRAREILYDIVVGK